VRFERDAGEGFQAVFPETFSFHAARHDPTELYLQLEDLWSQPAWLGAGAGRRDSEELMVQLLAALPGLLEQVLDRLEASEDGAALIRASEDVAVFALIAGRFMADKSLEGNPRLLIPGLHLRKIVLRALLALLEVRVRSEYLDAYVEGTVAPQRSDDPYDLAFFYALAQGEAASIDATLLGAAERAHRRWLEEVCLDEGKRAFEAGGSPFASREEELRRAVCRRGVQRVDRGGDLSPFLRRPGDRDCQRVLSKLETFFLRQYDVHHAAALRHHAALLREGRDSAQRVLSRHGTRSYLLALLVPSLPFLGAVLAYPRAPRLFDGWAALEVMAVMAGTAWFLAYRFMWRKDLTFFHASVPRIGAGIIVGYLPVFLIDEVWDLAEQSALYIFWVSLLLGSTTLLYLYVEVQRRLGDPRVAFSRARDIFLLGMIESAGFGLLVTSMLGPLMATRNWGSVEGTPTLEAVRASLSPILGELPRILGMGPFLAFPSAVFLMSFLAFFIGTFLQLLWEELPITEPL